MKRFFILVSMVALVAAGCTKTIIKNEVETPISFSTESGKLTRAIVQDDEYLSSQPFGVVAYAHQGDKSNKLMDTVQVAKTGNDWKSKVGKYYWPNDPTTSIDFYAYSPVINVKNDVALADHQKMAVTGFNQADNGAMSFSAYTHSNMYVDFMVATPVKGATYSNPDGDAQGEVTEGKVPMLFHHQMTQIIFTVMTNVAYSGVNFAVESITLKNIKDKAKFTHTYSKTVETEEQPGEGQGGETPSATASTTEPSNYGVWSEHAKTSGVYKIFPATESNFGGNDVDEYDYNFSNDIVKDESNAANFTGATGKIVTNATTWTTVPVTMIPQTMVKTELPPVAGEDTYASEPTAQVFEIVYTIAGTGVAKERVVKHVPFNAYNPTATAIPWGVNQKITYNVLIGLNEITFEPSVAKWDDGKIEQNDPGYHQNFDFQQ